MELYSQSSEGRRDGDIRDKRRIVSYLPPNESNDSIESVQSSVVSTQGAHQNLHRRTDTLDSSGTFTSLDNGSFNSRHGTSRSLISPGSIDSHRHSQCTGVNANNIFRRSTITSLTTLTDPRVLTMHQKTLRLLLRAQERLSAFNHDPTRQFWEEATRHYQNATKTAPHVELWARHHWAMRPGMAPSDSSVLCGSMLLPGWNSYDIIMGNKLTWRHSSARTKQRNDFAREAGRCISMLVERQSSMLEQLYWAVDQAQQAQQVHRAQFAEALRFEKSRKRSKPRASSRASTGGPSPPGNVKRKSGPSSNAGRKVRSMPTPPCSPVSEHSYQ